MKQIDESEYEVSAGEQITVEIEANKVGNMAGFVLDKVRQTPVSTNPITFRFPVTVAAKKTHFGIVDCGFAPNTANDAKFQIFVRGNIGTTTRFRGPDIKKTDPLWNAELRFKRP